MNREIKFRVWDKLTKKFDINPHIVIGLNGYVSNLQNGAGGLEDYELMQYTGLHDKNGKEIYEGDIVKCLPGVEFFREVVFSDGGYHLINGDNMAFPIEVVFTSHPDTAVVGNIHENPELLS